MGPALSCTGLVGIYQLDYQNLSRLALDSVIHYTTMVPVYRDYMYSDHLSSAVNPLTTGSCAALYWVGGILPPGLLLSIRIIIGLSQTFTGLSLDYWIIPGLKDNPQIILFFSWFVLSRIFAQLCVVYSLLSDWPASVGKSLLIVPLLTYTTQVSEHLGHIRLNPDQIISACLGSGLTPAFSSWKVFLLVG